jgi:two-component system chemotaxis response regulator CheY
MLRILVVDDSAATRAFIRSALESEAVDGREVEVDEAPSGFNALRLLPRSTYDMVITDINMPDINGLELTRLVRESEHHRNVAMLVISTQATTRDRDRGLAIGADGFLGKPFSPAALREAVTTSLALKRSA